MRGTDKGLQWEILPRQVKRCRGSINRAAESSLVTELLQVQEDTHGYDSDHEGGTHYPSATLCPAQQHPLQHPLCERAFAFCC